MRTTGMSLLVLLICALGAGAKNPSVDPAQRAPLVIEVEAGHLQLIPADQKNLFRSMAPFRVNAGSVLPRWRVVAQIGPISGPRGGNAGRELRPPQVSLVPTRAIDNPGQAWTGNSLPVDGTTVIALGGPTAGRIHEINTFDLVVAVDPLSAPGQYKGTMRIVPEVPGAPPQEDFVIHFDWNVVELLAVDMLTDVMGFDIVGPGITECANPAIFWVHSNHHEAEILISMEPLTGVDSGVTLPSEASVIGWGPDPGSARQNTLSAPFGRNDIRFVLGPGHHKIAVHARLQLSTEEPAGNYTGRIVITSRVIS